MNYLFIAIAVFVVILWFFRDKIKPKISANNSQKNYTIDDKYNSEKREREKEIDAILSKIGKNGIGDLSEKDRKRLDELSKK
ncbi:MAG: rhomboid family protein [Flavobacteriaceae bacterium]|jgi:hypothetical protein|nr:rhomboid family protein [Flavobacteriaceae bacterium]